MFRLATVLLTFSLLLTSGCAYHVMETPAQLPPSLKTVAVPIFVNHTNAYKVDTDFTQAVIRQLTARTRWRVVDHADAAANATLHGEITSYSVVPLTYDNKTGRSSSFVVTITASITLTGRDHKILYRNTSYRFRQQYEETQNLASFIQEDSAAERRLAHDFATSAVSDILESF